MNRYGLADGFLRGAELGFGLARQKKRDALEEQRLGLDKALRLRQMQSYDLQDETNRFRLDRMRTEAGRQDDDYQRQQNLRQIEAWDYLLQNGKDDGQLAGVYNEMGEYQPWLQGRNLADAKFSGFEMNNTGKGEPGLVTFIEGKDKTTGQLRRGVATERASSDPDDPVKVMPTNQIVRMIQDVANQGDALGNAEHAARLRQHALSLIQAEKVRLGGKADEPRDQWGEIQYRDNVGSFVRNEKDGSIKVLTTPNKLGYGSRSNGGSGGGKSEFTNQIHKHASEAFKDKDDAFNQVDNSLVRDLTISLAQDFDLQSGGALAPGVYIQVAKDASQGLSLSPQAAEQRAIKELNQGKIFGSYNAEDEEVQQRAQAILERDKAQFADRYVDNINKMMEYRVGLPRLKPPAVESVESRNHDAGQISLDDAVGQMIQRAKSKGADLSPEQARQYLIQKYPDRFGSTDTAAVPEQETGRPRYGMTLTEQAEQFNKDVVQPVGASLKRLSANMNESVKAGNIRAELRAAAKSGMVPPAKTLASWIPMLSPEDQSLALELMADRYPDAPETRKLLQE